MIDPVEVCIQAIKSAAPTLAGGQVASKNHYVGADSSDPGLWPVNTEGISMRLDGGQVELYLPVHDIRLEVRCFGNDQPGAMALLITFQQLARTLQRKMVEVSGGTALLYFMVPESGPSLLYDADLGKDFSLQFFHAKVHEQSVVEEQ
jgi:hypothetical protein